jgi:hypothetical protein
VVHPLPRLSSIGRTQLPKIRLTIAARVSLETFRTVARGEPCRPSTPLACSRLEPPDDEPRASFVDPIASALVFSPALSSSPRTVVSETAPLLPSSPSSSPPPLVDPPLERMVAFREEKVPEVWFRRERAEFERPMRLSGPPMSSIADCTSGSRMVWLRRCGWCAALDMMISSMLRSPSEGGEAAMGVGRRGKGKDREGKKIYPLIAPLSCLKPATDARL